MSYRFAAIMMSLYCKACVGFVTLMVLIASSGHYGFFNYLGASLSIALLHDGQAWVFFFGV
jgi:hypothetical protein